MRWRSPQRLSKDGRVTRVLYPGLPNHPEHAVAKRLLPHGYGGMVAFEIAGGGRAEVFRFLERVKLARPAPTLGDVATLVMHPATRGRAENDGRGARHRRHYRKPGARLGGAGGRGGHCRGLAPGGGRAMRMVDVGGKPKTERVAVATARVRMKPATVRRIVQGKVEKGDVLAAAQLAGVMAAKRTPDVIPLCHPIALSGVEVEVWTRGAGVDVRTEVKTVDRTGVEMEALTAAAAAALTVYDMCKSVDRGMVVESLQLEHKSGGRTGTWQRKKKPRK